MTKVNEMETNELLEKAVDYLRNIGMINDWLEEYGLNPSIEARERYCIYEEEDETPDYWEENEELIDNAINTPIEIPDISDEELEKEIKSLGFSFEFKED